MKSNINSTNRNILLQRFIFTFFWSKKIKDALLISRFEHVGYLFTFLVPFLKHWSWIVFVLVQSESLKNSTANSADAPFFQRKWFNLFCKHVWPNLAKHNCDSLHSKMWFIHAIEMKTVLGCAWNWKILKNYAS